MIEGRHNAKATEWDLGWTGSGTEQIAIDFEITAGECVGDHITYYGYLSDRAAPYTIKNLRTCGWVGDDISQIKALPREVVLTVEAETWEGKTRLKVKRIDPLGGVAMRDRMDEQSRAALAKRLKGVVADVDAEAGAPPPPAPSRAPAKRQQSLPVDPPGDIDEIPF